MNSGQTAQIPEDPTVLQPETTANSIHPRTSIAIFNTGFQFISLTPTTPTAEVTADIHRLGRLVNSDVILTPIQLTPRIKPVNQQAP
jgi:hypothetical protein